MEGSVGRVFPDFSNIVADLVAVELFCWSAYAEPVDIHEEDEQILLSSSFRVCYGVGMRFLP